MHLQRLQEAKSKLHELPSKFHCYLMKSGVAVLARVVLMKITFLSPKKKNYTLNIYTLKHTYTVCMYIYVYTEYMTI